MITEDYVSFEIAKLLKEKGFNENTPASYNESGEFQEGFGRWNTTPIYYSASTHQMAMAWLREVHNIVISIYPTIETDVIVREDYNYAIYKNKTVVYQSCSTSYEEAVEASLKYVLENLI